MKTQDMVRELLEVTERFNKTASPQIDRDRISHATNIIHLASKIFADSSQQWLNQPHKMLDDRVPLDIIVRVACRRQSRRRFTTNRRSISKNG
jgi:hypothetical protein